MTRVIDAAIVGQLLESVITIASSHASLAERRLALLNSLCDLLCADAAWWAWGRGTPESSSISTVAQFTQGFSEPCLIRLAEWAFSSDAEKNFTLRIRARMNGASQMTTRRLDIVPDSEWNGDYGLRTVLKQFGYESWLHSVRYSNDDTWSNFFFVKTFGKVDFESEDVNLIDTCMKGVVWVHSHIVNEANIDAVPSMTSRQRTVMMMLLKGFSRKKIAQNLAIAEDTVSDHIKAIYSHFGVSSANELAARFLEAR